MFVYLTQIQFESVWVIVNRMTKSAYFIRVNLTYSVEDYAKLYLKEMVNFHGVPLSIISDRGTQFTFQIWKSFQKGLVLVEILVRTLIPKYNGQEICTIKTVEDMLTACATDFKGN